MRKINDVKLSPRFKLWLVILLSLYVGGEGLHWILHLQEADLMARVVFITANVLIFLWVWLGIWKVRHDPAGIKAALYLGATQLCAALVYGFMHLHHTQAAIAVAAIWTMASAFVLGLLLIRWLLQGGWPLLGVARTLVDEAVRLRLVLACVCIMFVIVPFSALVIDRHEWQHYRLMSFLSTSLGGISLLLGFCTVILSTWTITSEVADRQVFLTMTKPVSRGAYLLGKWLGIMLLNALLLIVGTTAVYGFAMVISQPPDHDAQGNALPDDQQPFDYREIKRTVLVARESTRPTQVPGDTLLDRARQRWQNLKNQDITLQTDEMGPEETQRLIELEYTGWMIIEYGRSERYLFQNLLPARRESDELQLRLAPEVSSHGKDNMVTFQIRCNGRLIPAPPLLLNNTHYLKIPANLIDDNGDLLVEIANINPNPTATSYMGTVRVADEKGPLLYYRVGSFGPNLTRGVVMLWLRLGFLAMFGLACGTFLSFPIACLTALSVYVIATGNVYLQEALTSYSALPGKHADTWEQITAIPTTILAQIQKGEFWEACKVVIRVLGMFFIALVPSFGRFNPVTPLVEGQVISMAFLGQAALWITGVWTTTAGLVGWLVFRRRQLANISA